MQKVKLLASTHPRKNKTRKMRVHTPQTMTNLLAPIIKAEGKLIKICRKEEHATTLLAITQRPYFPL